MPLCSIQNVLYSAPIRDLLLQLAVADIYRARWTSDIHDEWIRAVLKSNSRATPDKLQRTRNLMDQATRDCLVTGYQSLIPSLDLPDPNDRHVLAAAIAGSCDLVVTRNLKHFPQRVLAQFQIQPIHPDDFLADHLSLNPDLFCSTVRTVRRRLKHPPLAIDDYLAVLSKQGLVSTVAGLRQYTGAI